MQELTMKEIKQVNGGIVTALVGIALVLGSRYAIGALARHAIGMAGAGLAGYGLADAAGQAVGEAAEERAKGERGAN